MEAKKRLRQTQLKKRKSLSEKEWEEKSQAICQHLTQHITSSSFVSKGKTILSYFHFRNEPNLDPLFTLKDYDWGVPRCVGKELSWHLWQPGDVTVEGVFGIREPHPVSPQCSPENVDLILVPAVACDEQGYRLGYGGGFYDRLFEQPQWQTIRKVGIIFDFAFVSTVPVDSWDVPLNGVCTELGWRFRDTIL